MEYVAFERNRNLKHAELLTRMVQIAYPGADVMVTHHITARSLDGEIIEIPSADTALFCPDFMRRVFGDAGMHVRIVLAMAPTECREDMVQLWLDKPHLTAKIVSMSTLQNVTDAIVKLAEVIREERALARAG